MVVLVYWNSNGQCTQGNCQTNIPIANGNNWSESHGTPTWGNNSVWLWSYRQVGNGFNRGGEGVNYSGTNFVAGQQYCVSFTLAADTNTGGLPANNVSMNVILTQGAVVGITGSNSNNPIPATPNPSQVLMNQNIWNNVPNTQTYTLNFTASQNFNNIWFFPQNPNAPNPQIEVSISNLNICTVCDPTDFVDYHYEDENGNDQTEFCVGEDVYVNGSNTFNTNNYFMDLWIVDDNGDYDWISGAGWISGTPDFVNITDLFENDLEHPITFEAGETYSVKLAIVHPTCGWLELQHDFTIVEPDSVAYHYEDENGNDKTEFCIGEDVYVNGSETLNTNNYFMDLWIVDDNGDYDWISGAGWISGSPDFVNITELFENDPEHPVTFQVGETYSVKLAINDPDCGWVSLQHDFTIIDCCDDFNEADFSLGVDLDYNFLVGNYESYDFLNATHEWYVFSSPNETGGPYTLEHQVTTTGDNNFVLYTEGEFEVYYTIIHKVITDCGEICYAQVQYQKEGKNPEAYTNVKAAEIDCGILDEILPPKCSELTAPTNLQANGATLSWDPVPGAIAYIISSPAGNEPQIECRCRKSISLNIATEETSYTLSNSLASRCFIWQVTAICEDGTASATSQQMCFLPILIEEEDPQEEDIPNEEVPYEDKVTLSPNPNNGVFSINMDIAYDSEVSIEVRDFYGRMVTVLSDSVRAEKSSAISWDGTGILRRGIYFIEIKTDRDTFYKKMIVK